MSFKKGFAFVLFSNMINLVISILTGFVLPKMLSVDSYSSIKLFQLYISYVGILHLGFSDGMYLKYGGKEIKGISIEEVKSEFKTFKYFQLLVMIICVSISLLLKNTILLFCSLAIIPINIGNYLRSLYQATGSFDKYAKFTNINTFLIFIVNMILLFIIKTDNSHLFIIGYLIAYFIYWIMLELEVEKIFGKEKYKASITYLFLNIREGFFLMLGNFSSVLFTSIDRLFVQNLMGVVKFAYYSFAVSIETLMNTVISPISIVMYNYLCKTKDVDKVREIKRIIIVIASILLLVVYPVKFIVDIWLTKYTESLNVLFLLFGAQYISIMVKCIHTNLYKAEKKQNKYFKIMLFIVMLSIIANIISFNILKSLESFAIATLLINIIWFIIGEYNFKKYRLNIVNYIYIFLILIVFVFSAFVENAIIACVIYLVFVIIAMLLFMKNTLFYGIHEIKNIIHKIITR